MQPEEPLADPEVANRFYEEALALGERFKASGNVADLDRSILIYRELLVLPLDVEPYAAVINDLGEDLRLRYLQTLSEKDLDEAVACFWHAAEAVPDPGYRMNLGNALRNRYLLHGRPEDLDAAVDAYESALAALPAGSPYRPLFAHNLACGLRDRHLRNGSDMDLERALELYREAAETPEPAYLPQFLSNLATALDNRYERTSRLEDLEEAIKIHEQAVQAAGDGHPQLASSLNNLGNALRNHGLRTRRSETVDRAVDAFREAIRITPETAVDLPSRWNNLGNALRDRFALSMAGADLADLKEAIEAYRQAVELIEGLGVFLNLDTLRNNLANALRTLHRRTGDRESLEEAVGLYERSYAETPESAAEHPGRASNLGNALLDRAALAADPLASDDRRRGTDLLQGAAKSFVRSPEAALIAARNWSSWALARELWAEAVEASRYALEATERIFGRQAHRRDKEVWLSESQGLMAEAAYAMARIGDVEGAVATLDRGLARLLAEALEAGDSGPAGDPSSAFAEIRRLAAETPLVYLTFTLVGGVALLVRNASAAVTPVWLPALRQDPLLDLLDRHFRDYSGWRKKTEDPEARAAWFASLDGLAAWSWQAAMEQVLLHLEGEPRIVLICSGLLSLIPWHAAWTEGAEGGRRWASDVALFTYAPSARGLAMARRRPVCKDGSLLAVAAPGRDDEPGYQPGLQIDAQIAAASREPSRYLEGDAAGRAEVLAELSSHRILHFSCHGGVVADNPRESWLRLGTGEHITLGDFLGDSRGPRLDQVDLAVLSACESAISGLLLPDEVISLPTGLLQAGAAAIVASLWAVDDVATVYLMARFYDAWRHGADPAVALSAAQRWLRETSNEEKLGFVRELRSSSPWPAAVLDLVEEDLIEGNPADREFFHIHYWGSFTYMGA